MKIVMVASHCCMRVQKIALPLIELGHEVHCIANRYPHFGEYYKTVQLYEGSDQLEAAIELHHDAEIFHVHNEPSWFVSIVKGLFPGKPVILDVHDSMLIRVNPNDDTQTRITVDERNNFSLADALVFVSAPQRRVCTKEFHLQQPNLVLPSYVPKRFYRSDAFAWKGGVVYQGRANLPSEIEKLGLPFFKYCEYTALAKEFNREGIVLNLYIPGDKAEEYAKHFKDIAQFRGSYPYDVLMRKIARHDWGLVGNIEKHDAWRYALPNKLFEYIAAGVPVVAINALESQKFIERHGLGIAVKTVQELKKRWNEVDVCRNNVLKQRLQWTMEKNIGSLIKLYEEIR